MKYLDRGEKLPVEKKKRGKKLITFTAVSAAVGITLAAILFFQKRKEAQVEKADNDVGEIYKMPEGTIIAYDKQGSGEIPVVLLHGIYMGADRKEWEYIAKKLGEKDAGYTVYNLDLPGFGNSQALKKPWSAYHYVKAIHHFLEDVVQKPAVIVGVGISADFAIMLSRIYEDSVKKLVLLSPEGIGKGFAKREEVRFLQILLCPVLGTPFFLFGTRKKAIAKAIDTMFYGKERIPVNFLEQLRKNARKGKGAKVRYIQWKTRFAVCDTKGTFAKISQPFLCIWGEKNEKNPPIYLEEAEKLQQKGEFMLFADTAELPHLENPKSFLQILEGFL